MNMPVEQDRGPERILLLSIFLAHLWVDASRGICSSYSFS